MKNLLKIAQKRLIGMLAISLALQGVVFVVPAQAADQNASRWRNDDGSETTATYAAAEDTSITGVSKGSGVRLRFGVDATDKEKALAEEAATVLDIGERFLFSAVVDTANGYAYFGTGTTPGRVIKVALGSGSNPPTRVGSVTLNSDEDTLGSAVIDKRTLGAP